MALRKAMLLAAFAVTITMSSSYRVPFFFVIRRLTSVTTATLFSRSWQAPWQVTNWSSMPMTREAIRRLR